MVLLTSVIFTRLPSAFFRSRFAIVSYLSSISARGAPPPLPCGGDRFLFLTSQTAHRAGIFQHLQPRERRPDDVVGVCRSDRLGEHVRDARRLDDRADGATG